MNSSNIERFGTVMSDRMKQTTTANTPTTIELATVNSNLSITPDSLGAPIPKGEYLVNLMLTGSKSTSKTEHTHSGGGHEQETGSGVHTHEGGEHDHALPDSLRNIRAGDRVVIVWCDSEAVVIAIAVSS